MRHTRVGLILAALGALGLGLWAEGCLFAPDSCTDLLVCPPKGAGGETGTVTSTATSASASTGGAGGGSASSSASASSATTAASSTGTGGGTTCLSDSDCIVGTTPTCDIPTHTCISCSDGVQNGQEIAVDCGGICKGCNGLMCPSASVCASGHCVDGRCCDTPCTGVCMVCNFSAAVGTCTNTPEGGLDSITCADATQSCDGAGVCKKASAQPCAQNTECGSGVCIGGVCRATNGKPCLDSAECASKWCKAGVACAACATNLDCPSGSCVAGVCKAPNGSPCSVGADCVGGKCQGGLCKLDNNDSCSAGLDCVSGFCTGGTCQSCVSNASCPASSSCGSAPALGINVCRLPTSAYCEPTLPAIQNCNAGVAKCMGFPATCK